VPTLGKTGHCFGACGRKTTMALNLTGSPIFAILWVQ